MNVEYFASGWLTLHEASTSPELLQWLEHLLKIDAAKVNEKSLSGETPLHLACQYNVETAVSLLLQYGANANVRDDQGRTPLMYAIMKGKLDIVVALLNTGHANPDVGDTFRWNPLHEATFKGNSEMVQCLIQAGASVLTQSIDGVTAVSLAAKRGHSCCLEKLLQVAMEKGQNEVLDLCDENGFTPLVDAARKGHVECVQMLLKFGANPNLKVNYVMQMPGCFTALHFAIYADHVECVKVLLDKMDLQRLVHSVDPNFTDCICPLLLAVQSRSHKSLKVLISHGFPVNNVHRVSTWQRRMHLWYRAHVCNMPPPFYQTSLSYAAAVEDLDTMKILLDCGASVNPVLFRIVEENAIQRQLSLSPVLSALCNKSWKAFDVLIERPCDISHQPDGICPNEYLLMAFYNCNSLKKLLVCGSDPRLLFQRRNEFYKSILSHLVSVYCTVSCGAFFRVLELLLEFTAVSGPVQHLFNDLYLECHQTELAGRDNKQYEERWKAIVHQIRKPSSLQNLCRVKIRQVMLSVHGYSSFRDAIHHLHLPLLLKEYLLYSDK